MREEYIQFKESREDFALDLTRKLVELYPKVQGAATSYICSSFFKALTDMEEEVASAADLYEIYLNQTESENLFIEEEDNVQVYPVKAADILVERMVVLCHNICEIPEELHEPLRQAFAEMLTKELSDQIVCSIEYDESDLPKKCSVDREEI